MEKFTIDLDKVLDDFEFNEVHSTSSNEKNNLRNIKNNYQSIYENKPEFHNQNYVLNNKLNNSNQNNSDVTNSQINKFPSEILNNLVNNPEKSIYDCANQIDIPPDLQPIIPQKKRSKNAVANVFSSLDDYISTSVPLAEITVTTSLASTLTDPKNDILTDQAFLNQPFDESYLNMIDNLDDHYELKNEDMLNEKSVENQNNLKIQECKMVDTNQIENIEIINNETIQNENNSFIANFSTKNTENLCTENNSNLELNKDLCSKFESQLGLMKDELNKHDKFVNNYNDFYQNSNKNLNPDVENNINLEKNTLNNNDKDANISNDEVNDSFSVYKNSQIIPIENESVISNIIENDFNSTEVENIVSDIPKLNINLEKDNNFNKNDIQESLNLKDDSENEINVSEKIKDKKYKEELVVSFSQPFDCSDAELLACIEKLENEFLIYENQDKFEENLDISSTKIIDEIQNEDNSKMVDKIEEKSKYKFETENIIENIHNEHINDFCDNFEPYIKSSETNIESKILETICKLNVDLSIPATDLNEVDNENLPKIQELSPDFPQIKIDLESLKNKESDSNNLELSKNLINDEKMSNVDIEDNEKIDQKDFVSKLLNSENVEEKINYQDDENSNLKDKIEIDTYTEFKIEIDNSKIETEENHKSICQEEQLIEKFGSKDDLNEVNENKTENTNDNQTNDLNPTEHNELEIENRQVNQAKQSQEYLEVKLSQKNNINYNNSPTNGTSSDVSSIENSIIEDYQLENTNEEITYNNGADNTNSNINMASNNMPNSILVNSSINLGKEPPYWIPDTDALNCMKCDLKFTVIRRRHHCRACGLVLCAKCCNMKTSLEYLDNAKARVCNECFRVLNNELNGNHITSLTDNVSSSDSINSSPAHQRSGQSGNNQPNPNNPLEYCSTIPPLQQINNQNQTPPSVMVPVSVLKRPSTPHHLDQSSYSSNLHGNSSASSIRSGNRSDKQVIFSDGIRPGCDLTELDDDWITNNNNNNSNKRRLSKRSSNLQANRSRNNFPFYDTKTRSFIPNDINQLPPIVKYNNNNYTDVTYTECYNSPEIVELLRKEEKIFLLQRNYEVLLKIVDKNCCINKQAWCFSTKGLSSVGQDEILILLECLENEEKVPKDVFIHLNTVYVNASKGNTITEMSFSLETTQNFLNDKNHIGFLFFRPTYQCLKNLVLPPAPYIIGILIHKWETPWAKIFPLRLLLRLGAEYRYYPCPIMSSRNRDSVYGEIGQTIINVLADFKNYSYTLPNVRGLIIQMEDRRTTVSLPRNRYDQVMRAINNSSENILAFAGNFNMEADSHLVCIQNTKSVSENTYSTHAINIQNKPRKITGASFIIFSGALKANSGLMAKTSIVEDGLMIQISQEQLIRLREALHNQESFQINCGCVNQSLENCEQVHISWTVDDKNFNVGVKSPIDGKAMDGIPSIRVHNGSDYVSGNRLIRWTEVFIIQNGDENLKNQDPADISKIAESISKATCKALIKYLDMLASSNLIKIGIRCNLNNETVSFEAGSNNAPLAPIYMKSLDDELIPILSNRLSDTTIVLELIFYILDS